MFKLMIHGGVFLAALLIGASESALMAQDTAKTTLAAAGRELKTAVGKKGEERASILKRARAIYEQVPGRWPEESSAVARAHMQMGLLSKKLGDSSEALRQMKLVVGVKGEVKRHAEAYIEMSKIERKAKRPEEAIKVLQLLLQNCGECERDCAEALLRISSTRVSLERFDEALVAAQQVLDEHPGIWRVNVDASNQICRVLIQRREWVKAVAKLKELDQMLKERFGSAENWVSVQSAMQKMSARRTLTPWRKEATGVPAS